MKLATLCYVRDNERTLMLLRNKKRDDMHQGKWNGLGGKLDPAESPEECARREVLEESGLVAEHLIFKGVLTFPRFSKGEDWYVFVFVIDRFSGRLIESPEGDLHWIDNTELVNLNLWEGDRIFLEWLQNDGIFSGKFTYINGRLSDWSVQFY